MATIMAAKKLVRIISLRLLVHFQLLTINIFRQNFGQFILDVDNLEDLSGNCLAKTGNETSGR